VRTVINAIISLTGLAFAHGACALTVFACEPEWASLTRALLPEARIYSATNHLQDPHHVEARPSLIARMRHADIAVCTGASLEVGWLPMLQERSGNPRIQNGQPGMFYASAYVTLIDQHEGPITPFSGDVHPEGNPHFHADPHRLLLVAQALRDRLVQLGPNHRDAITANHASFDKALRERITQWERQASSLQGKAVVAQHASFGYLWKWLKVEQVADLEPKPGMAPTPGHLERIRSQLKQSPASAIVVAQHQDQRAAKWLVSQEAGKSTPLLVLPATVTQDSADGILIWLDAVIAALAKTVP